MLFMFLLVISCSGGGGTSGASTTLNWSTPASDINGTPITVAGYKIYYGTESQTYTSVIDVGNVTTYKVSGLPTGATYYFAVTAYDATGVESDPTDEQSKTL